MKKEKARKQDLSAVNIGVFIMMGILMLALIIVGIISYYLPNVEFATIISSIGTVVTAILTGLYVYTTTQQIYIANQQLSEMKSDRVMQEQPLVFTECETFDVHVPKMYYSPPEKKYSYSSQYFYWVEVKNESSFAAISIDVTSELLVKTDDGIKTICTTSERIKFLGAHEHKRVSFLFLDKEKLCIYDALRQIKTAALPRVKTTILYKNLSGAYFKTENYSTIFPTGEILDKLIRWHTSITTAVVANKEAIVYLNSLNLDSPQRRMTFDKMKEHFESAFEGDDNISIQCSDEPLEFDFSSISKEEFEGKLVGHGYGRRIRTRGNFDSFASENK